MALARRLLFPSAGLQLQAILHPADFPAAGIAAVVCHPHPLYGGSMHNNVVVSICRELAARGCSALRFNYRGVGDSQGTYGGGIGEVDDAVAAVGCLTSELGNTAACVALVGYSFGASIALAACAELPINAVVAVSPGAVEGLATCRGQGKHKLLLYGGRDRLVVPEAVRDLFERLDEPKELHCFPEADHFWIGREVAVAEAAATFVIRNSGSAV